MSLRNSWDAIDAPRATTPPPPLYQRRRPQDRSSISSVLTTSTTASSIIVSPTTPTKQEWAPVRIASPTLGKGREWQGRDSWGSMSEDENLGTPRLGSFLDVKVPQTSKGSHAESQSWWAGVSLGFLISSLSSTRHRTLTYPTTLPHEYRNNAHIRPHQLYRRPNLDRGILTRRECLNVVLHPCRLTRKALTPTRSLKHRWTNHLR